MMGPGLSLEQAPPLGAPLRFFLTAPLFLVAAGLLAALAPEWSSGPHAAVTLALTHLVTLGFLAMVMLGALTQMLPVVAGAPVPAVGWIARFSHGGLALGSAFLAWGLGTLAPSALAAAGVLLGLGLGVFLLAGTLSVMRGRAIDTLRAMGLALAALAVTLALGLGLGAWLAGLWQPDTPLDWLAGHVLAGLAGWIGLLIMGTAWQVVPMLQLTPPYPAGLTRGLLVLAGTSLALALLPASLAGASAVGQAGLALCAWIFALATLDLQRRRKRKTADVALSFWRLGMVSLMLAALAFPLADSERTSLLAGLLFLLGFAASVVCGMLYKIVPFLAWFHLQAQQGLMAAGLPGMKDYLPDAAARGQFRLHLVALATLLLAPFAPALAVPGGLLLAGSAAWLGWNLLGVVRRFQAHGGRF